MPGKSDFERRAAYLRRYEQLKQEREPWTRLWRSLSVNFAPMLARFDEERSRKIVQRNSLLNSSPIRDAQILAAGMMTSVTSPARKWFKLNLPAKFDRSSGRVRAWLEDVENGLFQVFSRSNLYTALSATYLECGIFGVHAFIVEEDEQDVVRAYTLPIGTYCLASSQRRNVDTLYRDVWLTTSMMVQRFGLDACSTHVKELFGRGDRDTLHKCVHVIEPDEGYLKKGADYRAKPFRSVWFEEKSDAAAGFLRESGYNEFPVMAPRWSVVENDAYGSNSPGMVSLGDAKLLQKLEEDSVKLMENGAEPALLASAALRNQKVSLRPADVTYGDSTNGAPAVVPLHETPPHWISIIQNKILSVEEKVATAFFVDLFMGLNESDRREVTAEEIRARQQEKMLQLGPVLERLNDELLDPLINRVFAIAYRRGVLPPAPAELDSANIRVEYQSILTQAQKTVGVAAVQQFLASVGSIAQMNPEVLDKVDFDQVVDDFAEMYGVPPRQLADEADVDGIRQKRAEAQAQAASVAMGTVEGRHVIRWILGELKPPVISGTECVARAALYDSAMRLEESIFSVAPEEWGQSVSEATQERVVERLSMEDRDV